jgi:hypothetical protein
MTGAEWVAVITRYLFRSFWVHVTLVTSAEGLQLSARGQTRFCGFRLHHRGRLDLAGQDHSLSNSLAVLLDAMSSADAAQHVALHVCRVEDEFVSVLSLPWGTTPPSVWLRSDSSIGEVIETNRAESSADLSFWLLELWSYLRAPERLLAVVRVSDFSAARSDALLEAVQSGTSSQSVALHVHVVGTSQARRVAERAVHRHRSDVSAQGAVGFRRTARSERALERLREREVLVTSGRALLCVAVYVTVSAVTREELERAIEELERVANLSGLRCDRGRGRQALWYCFALPGGPGW